MKSYVDTYKQGLSFYNDDLQTIIEFINKGEHVALCSSLSTGEERFIDYLGHKLNSNKAYEVINITSSLQSVTEIVNQVQMSKKKCAVLIPYFYREIAYSSELLNALYQTFRGGEFVAVLKLPWSFHQNPNRFNEIAPFLTNVIIRQPLNFEEVQENIAMRKGLHGWNVPEDKAAEILQLSGGLLRLIKRILKFYDTNETLDQKQLLQYPALTVILAELAEMYAGLSRKKLAELGILDENDKTRSTLLAAYLQKENIAPKEELSPKMRMLFNLFYQNRNKLVTDEMIDTIVRKGKSSSLWANYKLVGRLRKALGDQYNIRTVKGKGYVLSEK